MTLDILTSASPRSTAVVTVADSGFSSSSAEAVAVLDTSPAATSFSSTMWIAVISHTARGSKVSQVLLEGVAVGSEIRTLLSSTLPVFVTVTV